MYDSRFYPSFDSERAFIMDFLPQVVKTYVSLRLVDSSKDFLSCCTNNKSQLGFVTSIKLPGEAVGSFSGYARL